MKTTIEFYGWAKRLAKTDKAEIDLGKVAATLRNVSIEVAKKFPELLGNILSPETFEPIETYRYNVNGTNTAQNLDVYIKEGDKILLIPIVAGG